MVRSNRIRSTYQRRILDWLADGGGTVTEVSSALGLRVPHASAALKKLRESGDVARDDHNLRGSRYRLSSQGLSRLEGDGLARLSELVRWPPPPGAAGIVLAREGSMLLLGYASMPAGPLLGLPDRPMNDESGVLENSSGNEGASISWQWAVQREEGPVWWDLESMRRAVAPTDASPMTLTAWMERPKVMGVVRAKLLQDSKPWPLGVGSWFTSLPSGHWPELPNVLRDGDAAIGRAGNSGPQVRPRGGVHARLGRRTERSLIVRNTPSQSLKIVDGDLLSLPATPLPREILRHWLKLIHPRLGQKTVDEKYYRLLEDIQNSASNALTRKVLNDFPGRLWTDGFDNLIDTRSISHRAAESIVNYALEATNLPIVLDWRWPASLNLLGRFASDSKCRMIICEIPDIGLPFVLTSQEGQGKFDLEMPGRLHLPISVDSDISVPNGWNPPSTPSELIRGNSSVAKNSDNQIEAMWQACKLADGDEEWADRHENSFPLASWIATPIAGQAARWRRIGQHLNPVWATLASLDDFDTTTLADLALVDRDALVILMERIRNNPLSIISLDTNHPAIATVILLSSEWVEEHIDVIEPWLSNPLEVSEVLRKNWNKTGIDRLVVACPHHSKLLNQDNFEREDVLGIMEDVHFSLWEKHSTSWLLMCMSSTLGRSALSLLDLPWAAILFKQDLKAEDLVLVHHMPEGIGTDSLEDVVEALNAAEEGRPPVSGKSHPLAGWLFQKQMPEPPLTTDFNQEIHLALHRRFQQ
jgi:hypothetical protein